MQFQMVREQFTPMKGKIIGKKRLSKRQLPGKETADLI